MTTNTGGDESVSGSDRQASRLPYKPAGAVRKRDYVAVLPEPVRLAINCRLRDGWRHEAIAEWLLSQTADRDIPELGLQKGDCYAALWLRRALAPEVTRDNCRTVISRWSHG
ncbi:MAG TPA: hypothetical protein VMV72_02370 [Verrucomicrobiae bacterium]|nr:hypothetical protein [Verrucomicrobiae bacterium]